MHVWEKIGTNLNDTYEERDMHGYWETIMFVNRGRVVKRPRMLKLGFFFL